MCLRPGVFRTSVTTFKTTGGKALFAGLGVLGIAVIVWLVRPDTPDFKAFRAGADRKQAFYSYFLPVIRQRNQEIRETRRQIREWQQDKDTIGWWEAWRIRAIAKAYRIEAFDTGREADWNSLLRRVDTVPPSLALAQAAKESAWGISRFASQGNNYFGQWCFEKRCGMVPRRRDARQSYELAVFDSPEASVESYMRNLNSHDAYEPLRNIRAQLKAAQQPVSGIRLVDGLGEYSEKGNEYLEELRSLIRDNDLTSYDTD